MKFRLTFVKLALNTTVRCQNHRPVFQLLSNQKKTVTLVLVNSFSFKSEYFPSFRFTGQYMHASYPVVYSMQMIAFQMLGPATEIPGDLPAATGGTADNLAICSESLSYSQWWFLIGPEMCLPLLVLHTQHLGGCGRACMPGANDPCCRTSLFNNLLLMKESYMQNHIALAVKDCGIFLASKESWS